MYAECNRVRTNKKFLRFDFKQGTRPGIANRVVLSEVNEKDLALDLNYILPKSVTVSEDQLSLSEIYIGGHKGPDFLLFEGARANNHGILSPDNDVVGDIAYMVNKSKGDLYTMHIQYTDISGVVHPSITSGSYFVHMIKLLLNSKGNVKVVMNRIPDSSLTRSFPR